MSTLDLKPLLSTTPLPNRLLLEAELQPLQGRRFQPTGFPDLGAALFDGNNRLLVESAQSMANRLENTIWDEGAQELAAPARGLSYVRVVDAKKNYLTSSIKEAHRLNSGYIVDKRGPFLSTLAKEFEVLDKGPISFATIARVLIKYDVNALLHGIFLANDKLGGGRVRIPRALSSFIEAEGVSIAASGGVKNDHVDPTGKLGGGAETGFGNVPFQRDEYTAEKITAFFNLDLAQIRSYGLDAHLEQLLVALALYKITALLAGDFRLRTACDLELKGSVGVRRPEGFQLPSHESVRAALPELIEKCVAHFGGSSGITTVAWANAS